jgi:photosystem II stability/assembly factor-like uncharacterized protein
VFTGPKPSYFSGMPFVLMLAALQLAAAPVTFQKATSAEALEWARQWQSDPLTLQPTAIVGIDREKVALIGALQTPAASVRSLLLLSRDGGLTFAETLPPVHGSQVAWAQFFGQQALALVLWTTEGPGEMTLFASPDGGNHWKRRGKIPKRNFAGWPEWVAFKDPINGTVKITYPDPETEPVEYLQTSDGGKSWQALPSAPTPPQSDPKRSMGIDGTVWSYGVSGDKLVVSRQPRGASEQKRGTLPLRYKQIKGEVKPAK